MSKKRFLQGTLILTCAGFLSRLIGFFYRIFLSHAIGAQGLGIFQLVLPLQALVMAVTASGIQTAISRMAASRMALGLEKEAKDTFLLGTTASLLLSAAAAFFIYTRAEFFAAEILREPRTLPLIRILAFSFPMNALHTCAASYHFARKETGIPSAVQLLEQCVKVGITYLLCLILTSEGREITPAVAAGGAAAGELAAALAALLCITSSFSRSRYSPFRITGARSGLRGLLQMSLPLTLNRLLITLLGSIEIVLIPQQLRASGLPPEEALGIYGVLTGMALPLILFPSTVTNSASVMLMPSVAELQALGYERRIRFVAGRTCRCCLLLGGFCTTLFYFFGEPLGIFLFHSPTAGSYIHALAFVCPFLYLRTMLASILNGLGMPGISLLNNVIGTGIRIGFVAAVIPVCGIRGYLYGMLLSEVVLTLLHFFALRRYEAAALRNSRP